MDLKAIDFEFVPLRSPMDFKKWNPVTGKMPVLELDGERFFDSTLILRTLDAVRPEPPLFSSDPETAARQRFLEDWSDESLYWYLMGLRWADVNAKASTDQIAGTLPALIRPVVRLILPRQIGGQATAQGLRRLPLEVLLDEISRRFDELVWMLGDRPFFFSDRVSAADLAIFGQLRTMMSGPTPQGEELIRQRAGLIDFYARVDDATKASGTEKRRAA